MKKLIFYEKKFTKKNGPFIDFSPHQSPWLFACDPKFLYLFLQKKKKQNNKANRCKFANNNTNANAAAETLAQQHKLTISTLKYNN